MSDDIGKVADDVIGRMKTTEELKHVPFEMYARVLARAERAEAECKAMREALQKTIAAMERASILLEIESRDREINLAITEAGVE